MINLINFFKLYFLIIVKIIIMGACGEIRTRGSRNTIFSSTELEYFFKQTDNSLCRIKSNTIGFGTGFLCNITYPNMVNFLPVLITNSNILGFDDISIGKNIIFFLSTEKHKIKIDETRKTYINENYNITIIEIKDNDRLNTYTFIKIDEDIYNYNSDMIYNRLSVYLLYYEKNKNPKHSSGEIKSINITNNTFEHSCFCELESLGAPILNLSNYKVIGMHKGIKDGNSNENNINLGIIIREPLEEYYKLYYKKKNKKSRNIDSNEKIHEINLIFQYSKEKELILAVKSNISFKEVIDELYNKYIWLNNIKIIDFQFNGKSLSKNNSVKENNLSENSNIIIVEEKNS